MKKYKNIARIDNDLNRTYAWLVQVQRNSKITVKMFTDGVYGGKRKSFNAALEFRNEVLAVVSNYAYHINRRTLLRKNNKSGISGVGRYEVIQNINTGAKAAFWSAFWDDENGIRRSRKFYVSCYGERNAKKLAVAKRQEMLKEVCTVKCA